jgi:molybdate transport system regulatory protein
MAYYANLEKKAVNSEVKVNLGEGLEICAIITHEAVEDLGFAPAQRAYALIKASHVILAVND